MPYALRDKVSLELDKLVKDGVLSEVESSEWASPIVPIVKADGSIRICGDYKVTVNPHLIVDKHPIPRINDLISATGGCVFAKLDMSQAYLQLSLCPESKKLTTISTHRGLFSYNKLPFGIASAPSIFQREMEKLFFGMNGIIVYFDDIFISGINKIELLSRIESVVQKLADSGLTLNKNKCSLFKDSVQFLGFKIDKNGISIPEEKVSAIKEIPCPQNVTELKSFLGLVTYYCKFISKLANLASSLYALLRKDSKWKWSNREMIAFKNIKSAITTACSLAHYDPKLELVLNTDASAVGVSGVLSQRSEGNVDIPIAFCSRALTPAERQYSVLDREALALVFSVKYFHQYLYGNKFTLMTDHRPLISIFGDKKGIPSMYFYKLICIKFSM